jgi:hypothetical protein
MKTSTPHLVRSALFAALLTAGLINPAQAAAPKSNAAPAPKLNVPAASPAATLKQRVGFTDVELSYSRPSMKNRKIFGGLVPYGEVWRTGANTATKISFSTPVRFSGRELPAGDYALYTIPGQKEWTIIFNRVTGEWGAYAYKQENDALRITAKPVTLAQPIETFTLGINDIRTESATLNLMWEKTHVPVKFEFDTVQNVIAQIDRLMGSGQTLPPNVYYSAAMFYYDHGLDLKKARGWVEEATKGEKPQFFMLHGKAKILAKLGDKPGAIAAARQSTEAAQGAAKAEYTRLNEALIASLK